MSHSFSRESFRCVCCCWCCSGKFSRMLLKALCNNSSDSSLCILVTLRQCVVSPHSQFESFFLHVCRIYRAVSWFALCATIRPIPVFTFLSPCDSVSFLRICNSRVFSLMSAASTVHNHDVLVDGGQLFNVRIKIYLTNTDMIFSTAGLAGTEEHFWSN